MCMAEYYAGPSVFDPGAFFVRRDGQGVAGGGGCAPGGLRGEHVMQRIKDYSTALEGGQDADWPTPTLADEWVNEYAPH